MSNTVCDDFSKLKTRHGVSVEYFDQDQWKQISWPQYYDLVEDVAGGLLSLGLKAEDKVALLKAKFDVRRAELEVGRNELVSDIDAKKNLLTLEQAKRHLEQLQQRWHRRHAASA